MSVNFIMQNSIKIKERKFKASWALNHWQLYGMLIIPFAYIILFRYVPMYGVTLAFKDFMIKQGIQKSPWADPWYKWFEYLFGIKAFPKILTNTLVISFYGRLAGFIPPIFLALMLNESLHKRYKKYVQLITYAPHFISSVIIVGILTQVLSRFGTINNILVLMGFERTSILNNPKAFRHLYVWSGIWQSCGYSAIIYLAALAGVNPSLYEAAKIDGASVWQKIWNIDIPSILPTATILLILSIGQIMNIGFEKAFLLQNALNMGKSEIIATFVYKVGLQNLQYSYATAVGLFQSVINLLLIVSVNAFARKFSETSLW